MKVITIKQPWATLIAEGYKKYEFRTWRTKFRGEILIHAGKSVDKKAMQRFKYLNLEYPLGKIIAKAVVTDCVVVDDKLRKSLFEVDQNVYKGIQDSTWNGYGIKLENVEKIKEILVNGKLSLWDYDYKE
mgnify:CR=1 FL=1